MLAENGHLSFFRHGAINTLLKNGTPPANIIYITFDHPIIKLAGIDQVVEAWRGYAVTKLLSDFGMLAGIEKQGTEIMLIPAPLLCYWMGQSELSQSDF